MGEETITVRKVHYDYLRKRDEFLTNLEAAGVDNWDGYHCGFGKEAGEEEDL